MSDLDTASPLTLFAMLSGVAVAAAVGPNLVAAVAGVFALAWLVQSWRSVDWSRFATATWILFALFGLWGGLSVTWSYAPATSAERAVRLVVAVGLALVLAASIRPAVRRRTVAEALFLWLYGLAAAYLGLEFLHFQLFREPLLVEVSAFNRSGSVLCLLFWPFALLLLLRGNPAVFAAGTALAVFTVLLSPTKAAGLAMVIGLAAAAPVLAWPRLGARLGARLMLAVLVVAGLGVLAVFAAFGEGMRDWALHSAGDSSIRHRALVWAHAASLALDRPLFGWGIGSARVLPGSETVVNFLGPDGNVRGKGEMLPLHPHHAFLQVWLETGLVGLGLLLAALGAMIGRLAEPADRVWTAAVTGAFTAAMVMLSISYGAWQGWWMSLLVLVGLALRFLREPAPRPTPDVNR